MSGEKPISGPTLSIDYGNVEVISKVREFSFADGWYELTNDSHFWFQWRLVALLGQLKRLGIPLTAQLKALEIGGGTGVLRSQIERSTQWWVDMTDLDIDALTRSEPGRGRIMYYDIREERESFIEAYDVVVLFDVLEHIPDTQPFLSSVIRHIKPNGFLLVNVPALQTLYSKYDETVGHVRRYNRKTLAKEFNRFNIEIHDICYWGMTMVPVVALRKFIFRMLWNMQEQQTISCGFEPPHPFVNRALSVIMRIETAFLSKPPFGTSVLMAGQKFNRH
jgi:2-polyprenyl-3-methyl-5-hydroxy-6-metoxy-1,4-benzoquinol methylase